MRQETRKLDGLTSAVEILVDRWGVPHIYAENEPDLFFAQGYNAASERLFQMDLWRRRGLGLLSEAFGARYLEQDRAARLFLYRGDIDEDWASYGPDVRRTTISFVAGINAFTRACLADPELLPTEFAELGYLPAVWEANDIPAIRSHGIYHNVEQEVLRARTLAEFGPAVENLRRYRTAGHRVLAPDETARLPEDVLRVYRLAMSPVTLAQAEDADPLLPTGGGSNNWVLGRSKTASGRPILANDPHRALTLPSLRYLSHLKAPGLDVIGAGEPSLPGVSIGHNGALAFGLTIFAIDQEDLYVYVSAADDPRSYAYGDGHESTRIVRETIPVRDAEPHEVELEFTRHGPVIYRDDRESMIVALRAAWLEPGMAPYLSSAQCMRANDPEEFLEHLSRWGSPGENQVYASPDGQLGWQAGGKVPIRNGWDGTLPVAGDGRHEWGGYRTTDALPGIRNPASDFVATANEMNLPDGWQETVTIGHEWYANTRVRRIREALATSDEWTIEGCVALQNDELSLVAREVLPHLFTEAGLPLEARDVANRMRQWDHVESVGSIEATVFEIWYRKFLRPRLLGFVLQGLVTESELASALEAILPFEEYAGDPRVDLVLLRDPALLARVHEAGIFAATFTDAIDHLRTTYGEATEGWEWGSIHRAHFIHPLQAVDPGLAWTALEPVPRGGGGDTVMSTCYNPAFTQVSGATFSIVVDVGEWDNSVAQNAPGQSGRSESPHFADNVEAWSRGSSFPLLYSRHAVEAAAESRLILTPPSPGSR